MKLVLICCVGAALFADVAPATAKAQNKQSGPTYTLDDDGVLGLQRYEAAHNESSPPLRVRLLDAWVRDYPQSPLMPYTYRDYYLAYFSVGDYVRAIAYVDKEVGLGDKVDVSTRLEALTVRTQSFLSGCGLELQSAEAYAQAKAAAALGKQLLGQWDKDPAITEAQFADRKERLDAQFDSVIALGQNNGKTGDRSCKPPDPSNLSDLVTAVPVVSITKVTGLIADSTGGTLPKAVITFRAKRFERTVLASDDGHYEVDLPVGRYDVTARIRGCHAFRLKAWDAERKPSNSLPVSLYCSSTPAH